MTIEILPDGKFAEITTANNSVTFVPGERPEREPVATPREQSTLFDFRRRFPFHGGTG